MIAWGIALFLAAVSGSALWFSAQLVKLEESNRRTNEILNGLQTGVLKVPR